MAGEMDDMTGEELPAAGVESRLLLIIAATPLLAGLLLASLSRRSKRLPI